MNRSETALPEPNPWRYKGIVLLGPTGSGKTPLGQLMVERGIWGRRCVHFDFGNLLRRIAFDQSDRELADCPTTSEATPLMGGDVPPAAEIRRIAVPASQGAPPFGGVASCNPHCSPGSTGAFSEGLAYFTPQERDFVRQVLGSGALLEDKDFPLAVKIFQYFLIAEGLQGPELLRQPPGQPLPQGGDAQAGVWIVLNGLPRHVGQAEALKSWVDVQAAIHLDCPAEVVLQRLRSNVGGDRHGRTDDDLPSVQAKLATYQARTQPLIHYYQSRGVPIVRLLVTAALTPAEAWEQLQAQNPWPTP